MCTVFILKLLFSFFHKDINLFGSVNNRIPTKTKIQILKQRIKLQNELKAVFDNYKLSAF